MATDLRNLPAYLANDANFRTWGSGIAAQLAAVGMVQTGDTGQINWTTVNRPGSNNTFAGYEIWRFPNSAEQTACPIFLKIEYGVGTGLDRPSLRFLAGSGSNGSGTLTGQVQAGSGQQAAAGASKTAGVTLPSYCAGGNGWLHLVANLDNASANFSMGLIVERATTSTGTVENGGFLAHYKSGTGTFSQVIPVTGTVPAISSASRFVSSGGSATVLGADVALWPGTWMVGGRTYFTRLLAYLHTDIGELASITVPSYQGGNRTYMPLGDGGGTHTGLSTDAVAILWE